MKNINPLIDLKKAYLPAKRLRIGQGSFFSPSKQTPNQSDSKQTSSQSEHPKIKLRVVHIVRRYVKEEWGGIETHLNQLITNQQCEHEILSTCALQPSIKKAHSNKKQLYRHSPSNPNKYLIHRRDIEENLNQPSDKASTPDDIADFATTNAVNYFSFFYPYLFISKEKKLELDKKGGNPISIKMFFYLLTMKKPHIIHCHADGRLANIAWLAAFIRGIPFVLTLHGGKLTVPKIESDNLKKKTSSMLGYGKIWDILFGRKRFYRKISHIIVLSKLEKNALIQQKYAQTKNISIIGNAMPLQLDSHRKNNRPRRKKIETPMAFEELINLRKRAKANIHSYLKGHPYYLNINVPEKCEIILCLSRIDPQKNQKLLIDLMHQILHDKTQSKPNTPPPYLLIIGPATDERYLCHLKHYAQQKSVASNVLFHPGFPFGSPKIKQFYLASDIFILPSSHEPFGIVILEAWAMGTPVICSRTGGLEELVDDEKNGFLFSVGPNQKINSKHLYKTYCRYKQKTHKQMKNLRLQAFHIVQNQFTVEKMNAQTQSVYQRLKKF